MVVAVERGVEQRNRSRSTLSTARHARGNDSGEVVKLYRGVVVALVIADLLALALTTGLTYFVRQFALGHAPDLAANIFDSSPIMTAGWLTAIALFGGYRARLVAAGADIYRNVLHASLAAAGIVGAFVYLANVELSRVYFVIFFVIGPLLLLVNRFVARRVMNKLRNSGRFRQTVVMVGSLSHVDELSRIISRETWLGYDVIGALTPEGDARQFSAEGISVLGNEGDLLDTVRREKPAVLMFTAGAETSAEQFRRTSWQLENDEIDVIVAPALTEVAASRVTMRPVAGLPLVHLDMPRSQQSLRWGKRLFDIIASGLGLLIISPVLLIIALVVKLNDGGPVIFRQERVGRNGETFEFLKFRSMVTNAEEVLRELRANDEQDSGNTVMFKMKRDPRITAPGRFLRRYSLDELPQLWNVLRGDMSLVGPRPALPHEVSGYNFDARRRLSVRPGITGLWQVSGRSDLSWDETVRLDMYYVDNWSFMQDVQILFRTVRAVVSSSGAY